MTSAVPISSSYRRPSCTAGSIVIPVTVVAPVRLRQGVQPPSVRSCCSPPSYLVSTSSSCGRAQYVSWATPRPRLLYLPSYSQLDSFIHTHISVDITSKYYFKTNDMTKSIACEVPAAYLSALNAVFLFAISNKKSRVLESLIHANVNGLPRFVYTYSTVIAVSH